MTDKNREANLYVNKSDRIQIEMVDEPGRKGAYVTFIDIKADDWKGRSCKLWFTMEGLYQFEKFLAACYVWLATDDGESFDLATGEVTTSPGLERL